MNPSTRTPEGEPNQCPVCRGFVRIDPSRPPGDAPCPSCGHLLWFGDPVRPSASQSFEEEFRRQFEAVSPNPELAGRVRETIRRLIRSRSVAMRTVLGDDLTDREMLVFERLLDGKTISEIAAETGLYERAVRRIVERLRVVMS